jgi:hypothetical protein
MTDSILRQEEAEILNFRADGAYDGAPVYMSLAGRKVKNICIPPRKYARIRFRLKTIFGDRLSFRKRKAQESEARIKCNLLNLFHSLGMSESFTVMT